MGCILPRGGDSYDACLHIIGMPGCCTEGSQGYVCTYEAITELLR